MRRDFLGLRRVIHSRSARRRTTTFRVEELENRLAPAATIPTFTQTNLVSDVPGMAKTTDPNLVNPWGMTLGTNGGIWVSDAGAGKATTYDGAGQPIPAGSPLVVTIPAPGGGTSAPTGVATNGTSGFVISAGGNSGPSTELFATEDGTIAGWNSAVDSANAVIAVDNSAAGAIYKGLAEGFNASGAFLFATDFHNGKVDVFDSNFKAVLMPGGFTDPNIPAGFAPFGISAINGHLYVTYAKQDANKEDDVPGPGEGFIDIFDTEGSLEERFATRGQLNAPWGMAWAPFQGFGDFNNALFVGNFGDGTVNAFDFDSGAFLGAVNDAGGKPIQIDGVWGLQFGLTIQGATRTLFFTAGTQDETHGLFGTLKVNAASLSPPPAGPTMRDPNLQVTTVVGGLSQPTGLAFLGPNDFLVIEKATGKVQHVVNGAVVGTALDLAVNSASERGLLGIALQPAFATTRGVYLYWTQSSTGADSSNLADVPLLGNRVDRYVWDPATQMLTFDKNILALRSFQQDPNQPLRGNHDGGKVAFGPDGKLYILIGDQGRRGQLQNLAGGPSGTGQADDQFGGPVPDDAHVTGVIFRLNPDGTTPADNPFAGVTAEQVTQIEQQAGVTLTPAQLDEVVANIHKVFSYGRRNSFGLAFDPATGSLWESENGDDAFDEINRVTAGSNGGWIQVMGPLDRVADFKEIETTFTQLQGNLDNGGIPLNAFDTATFIAAMQQLRWPPSLIADSPAQAQSRLFALPGSHYEDPEFSWEWAVAPAAIGFAGTGLGAGHAGDLFVGAARTFLDGGYLFEFKFDAARQHFAFNDPESADRVADNEYKFDEDGSEDLIVGEDFGITTDIQTGPDGNLYVLSLTGGAVYKVSVTAAANTAPTISDIPDIVTVPPGQGSVTVTFTVGDAETPVDQLRVTATAANSTLLPASSLVLGGTGATRTLTITPPPHEFGDTTVTVTVTDAGGGTATETFTLHLPPAFGKRGLVGHKHFAAGGDTGSGSVTLFNADRSVVFTATPFPGFTGGVRVAVGDFNGDGVDDLAVGTGAGAATQVVVLDGKTQAKLFALQPFEESFTGGVFVAAGDVNDDGIDDLVVTPDQGGGPRVRVLDGKTFTLVADFFGIEDVNFRGGARAAVGDVNGDGVADLVVAAGFQGGPRVATFDGTTLRAGLTARKLFGDFFAFEQTLRNGVFVAAGDLDGDGMADVIAGGGPGGGPRITGFSAKDLLAPGRTLTPVANFFAGDVNSRAGVRLAVKDLDIDDKADLVVGPGQGAGGKVTAFLGKNIAPNGAPPTEFEFDAIPGFNGGLFVG